MDLTGFINRANALNVIAVIVSQHGQQLAKHNWDDDCRRNVYSASKSFISAAVGIAQREGLLSIDEKLTDAFPDDLPAEVSDNLARATVRDLLTMQLGQAEAALMGMLSKHLVSVADMCMDQRGSAAYSIDQWEEKITDSMNYLFLLKAIIREDNPTWDEVEQEADNEA